MRNAKYVLLAVGAAASLAPGAARAQVDVNPPLPNVLLLVDTSGSMENMINGQRPENVGAACSPGIPTPMNRWATLLSVLTGTIENFSCQAVNRSSSAFINEYKFDGANPYDASYYLDFHRPYSNGCSPGPGNAGNNWYEWKNDAIKYRTTAGADCSTWSQSPDGILDVFKERVRFGLMTFDPSSNAGTGASGNNVNGATGMQGMWSYFLDWQSAGSPATGNPPNCAVANFEVGARNPAAPPWEGRLIPFGVYDAPLADTVKTNDHIQEALIAMRPYGATPLAGMLSDARDFILSDVSIDPSTGEPFGPANDPFFAGGCRETFIIVLSDGEPNLDLRDACATGNGKCPYQKPYEIAADLATQPDPDKRVKTFAVGFGLSTANGVDCKTLTTADLTAAGGQCENATGSLKACCTLGRIAYEGGSGNAYYADDIGTLKSALSAVLSQIASGSTSRTFPVFGTASATAGATGDADAASYQFVSSFDAPIGQLWTGNLERKRYVCEPVNGSLTASLKDVEPSLGDDFVANLNSNDTAHPRKFYTVLGDDLNDPPDNDPVDLDNDDKKSKILSQRSIRPALQLAGVDDGLGLYGGTVKTGDGATFSSLVAAKPEAMDFIPKPAACGKPNLGNAATSTLCAERVMRWEVGESNGASLPTRDGSEFGSIYHSTPAVVGPPHDFLRDESYSVFAVAQAKRPLMLYTATTDGQLHAFKVAANDAQDQLKVDKKENNELWSFLPPYVLPGILSQYDQTQQILLDGPPIVKDVVFDRTVAQAEAGFGAGAASWNTVLVAGGRGGGGFYYALDVTDPTQPKFLWQLSTDEKGKPLFGLQSGTPAITTIALEENNAVHEVAVAILPGGFGSSAKNGSCDRFGSSFSYIDGTYPPRSKVRCWKKGGARTLTVVRLKDGKVLMSFRGHDDDGTKSATRKKDQFDSPVNGVPVPYPSAPGQIANRVYVGDADGSLWRVDLSSPKPTDWKVNLLWDAYTLSGDGATSGERIQTPPIVSVDPLGNVVVLFSTGDQEVLTASANMKTRVWSITEKPIAVAGVPFSVSANWFIPFTGGKRVTGPLSLFNSVAYFATYSPEAGGGACSQGFGSVWGVHFANNCGKAPNTCQGGDQPTDPWPQYAVDPQNLAAGYVREKAQPAGTTVFGVAVTQTPSCTKTEDYTDAYLGAHTALKSVTAGEFQLVFQTGKGGTSSENSKTNTTTETLPRPRESTRIDSWASIVE